MLPFVLAWRRHLLGGIVIVAVSIYFIWYIWLGPIPPWFETRAWTVYVLPLWALSCAGGLLHLVAWWKEREKLT
jgi:hypothetical protein